LQSDAAKAAPLKQALGENPDQSMKPLRVFFSVLSPLIWFGVIFIVVVLGVQDIFPEWQSESPDLSISRYLNGSLTITELIGMYWPREILIALVAFILFEFIGSKRFSALIGKIRKAPQNQDPIEALDFDIKLESENSRSGLATIEIRNDDETPIKFVLEVLEEYFRLDSKEALKLALEIHTKGNGRIQWIEIDTAKRVLEKIAQEAKKRDYPLICTIIFA